MNLMNRDLQLELLTVLAGTYPNITEPSQFKTQASDEAVSFNMMYLAEHELVVAQNQQMVGAPSQLVWARITAKGLDFLQDDGGLGAILNVVTVRLDAETIRGLVEDKIESTPMPEAQRSALRKWLSGAGQEALKEATKRLVQAALDHAPDALRLLQSLPG